MKCLVDKEGKEQRVTFLYTLAPGPCPKSFGINVARLAQLPEQVCTTATSMYTASSSNAIMFIATTASTVVAVACATCYYKVLCVCASYQIR
jgi:DNA mismatch repair ATPase MutS